MEEGAIKGQVSESTLQPGSAAAVRVLEILLADRERSGDLDSDRVDSLMDKRSLDATERVWVYRQLGMDSRASVVEAGLDDPEREEENGERSDSTLHHVRFLLGATRRIEARPCAPASRR